MSRTKLYIVEVKEPPRPVGQTEVLDFMAHTGEGSKTLKYGVWSKSLYEYIKKDAVIECDVVVKESEKTDDNGQHYINRKVTMIYVNGEAVKKSGGGRGISPEERVSIERQTCLKCSCEVAKPEDSTDLIITRAEKFYRWLSKGETEEIKSSSDQEWDKIKTKDENPVTKAQLQQLEGLLKEANITSVELTKVANEKKWKIAKWSELKVWQFEELKTYLQKAAGK